MAGTRLLILFPGALGDFLCALPAFAALQRPHGGRAMVVANLPQIELLDPAGFEAVPMHRREIAELFGDGPVCDSTHALLGAPTIVHSWTGSNVPGFADRLRAMTGATVHLHRFRGMQPGEHAIDYYARCTGITPTATRPWIAEADYAWAQNWIARHAQDRRLLLVHPGSGSPRKNWEGFHELIGTLQPDWRPVIVLGAAELERGGSEWGNVPRIENESLRRLAALLSRADAYVGNDSGVRHLSAAVGTPTLALFGPSDPATWAPRGSMVRVLAAPETCARCGPDRFCTHRLSVDRVREAVVRLTETAG
jgi:ADP-heptose:LPS heptosyltransferase